MAPRFFTPPAMPEDEQCRGLSIPASKEWLAIFSQALLETTYPYHYAQLNETDLTADEVARTAYAIYEAWLQSTCSGGARRKIVRQNPDTGRWEQSTDDMDTWEFPDGDMALPAVTPRAEVTSEMRKCAAATNAAHTLHLLYDNVRENLDIGLPISGIQSEMADYAGELIAAGIGAIIGYFSPLAAFAWEAFLAVTELIQLDVWTAQFNEALICILKANATDEDGVITFDRQAINRAILGTYFQDAASILLMGQVIFLIEQIGTDGLNLAGRTTAVAGACNCAWTVTWEGENLVNGSEWRKIQGILQPSGEVRVAGAWPGSYAALQVDVPIPQGTTIQAFGVWWRAGLGPYHQAHITKGPTPWIHSGQPDDAPYGGESVLMFQVPAYYFDTYVNFDTADVVGTGLNQKLTVSLRSTSEVQGIKGIRVSGVGPCPFRTGVRS